MQIDKRKTPTGYLTLGIHSPPISSVRLIQISDSGFRTANMYLSSESKTKKNYKSRCYIPYPDMMKQPYTNPSYSRKEPIAVRNNPSNEESSRLYFPPTTSSSASLAIVLLENIPGFLPETPDDLITGLPDTLLLGVGGICGEGEPDMLVLLIDDIIL